MPWNEFSEYYSSTQYSKAMAHIPYTRRYFTMLQHSGFYMKWASIFMFVHMLKCVWDNV